MLYTQTDENSPLRSPLHGTPPRAKSLLQRAPAQRRSPLSVSTRHQTRERTFTGLTQRPLRTLTAFTPSIPQKATPALLALFTSDLVVLGDAKCGKSTLIHTYLNQRFTQAPESILFDTYEKTINFSDNTAVTLQIWDFPGDHQFDRLRPLLYANCRGVVFCFNVDNPQSFHNIRERWLPEVEEHCPNAHRFLVGLGAENRWGKTESEAIPNFAFFEKSAEKMQCQYFECLTLSPRSYSKVFENMALLINKEKGAEETLHVPKVRSQVSQNDGVEVETQNETKQTATTSPDKRRTSFHKKHRHCIIM